MKLTAGDLKKLVVEALSVSAGKLFAQCKLSLEDAQSQGYAVTRKTIKDVVLQHAQGRFSTAAVKDVIDELCVVMLER